jgi:hypothetical protein
MDFAALRALTAKVCRNALCFSTSLASLSDPPEGAGSGIDFNTTETGVGMTGDSISLFFTASGGRARGLEAHWWPGSAAAMKDGDEYRLTLEAPDGSEVLAIQESVTYTESFPNGRECAETACRHAEIMAD